MTLRIALVLSASVFLVGAQSTRAQEPGWYAGFGGGWTKTENMKDQGLAVTFHDGFNAILFGGYDLGVLRPGLGGLRAEAELGYREGGVHGVLAAPTIPPGGPGVHPGGTVGAHSLMLNGIYSFLPESAWTPYLGVGVGGVDIRADHIRTAAGLITNDSAVRPAYQGIAGMSYAITRQVSLALDYRYFAAADDPKFTLTAGGGWRPRYATHNALLSLTWHFGAPPPPPPTPVAAPAVTPPPAPPAVARTTQRVILVFFDWDKATLTPEGDRLIQLAADAFKQGGSPRIDLTGYTDTSGSVKYNLGLSRRRADAVRNRLLKLGVRADAITVTGRGKENLRVPTADNVREPQNRRVEIVVP